MRTTQTAFQPRAMEAAFQHFSLQTAANSSYRMDRHTNTSPPPPHPTHTPTFLWVMRKESASFCWLWTCHSFWLNLSAGISVVKPSRPGEFERLKTEGISGLKYISSLLKLNNFDTLHPPYPHSNTHLRSQVRYLIMQFPWCQGKTDIRLLSLRRPSWRNLPTAGALEKPSAKIGTPRIACVNTPTGPARALAYDLVTLQML